MDPNACYSEFVAALGAGDVHTAAERADALYGWFARGGYVPASMTAAGYEAGSVTLMFLDTSITLQRAAAGLETQ